MALLGKPYTIYYWAKNFTTGLSNITAKVIRPDNIALSTMTLSEESEPGFEGLYSVTINLPTSYPEGSYRGVINSSDESIRSPFRIEFEKPLDLASITGSIGINRKSVIEADVRNNKKLEAQITKADLFADLKIKSNVEAYFYKDELDYFLDNNELKGDLE